MERRPATESETDDLPPAADDDWGWTDQPEDPDAAGAPGEFVDVGDNPPGEEGAPGTPTPDSEPPTR